MTETRTVTGPDGTPIEVDADLIFGTEGGSKPVPFIIDDELYFAAARIPLDDYGKLTSLVASLPQAVRSGTQDGTRRELSEQDAQLMIDTVIQMTDLFLLTESSERLAERMKSKENPVDIRSLMDVVNRLMTTRYGAAEEGDERPTKPTSD